jgi:hypothetical protein
MFSHQDTGIKVQTPIGTKPRAGSPAFASFHRRDKADAKSPKATTVSSSADYEDIEDDEDEDPPLEVRVSSTVKSVAKAEQPSKVPTSDSAEGRARQAEATASLERAIARALQHAADAGVDTTLSPFTFTGSLGELPVGKPQSSSGTGTSSSSTAEEMPQPKRVATVIRLDADEPSTDPSEEKDMKVKGGKAGPGHRRGFSFQAGDDTDPATLRHASLTSERSIHGSLSSAACTVSESSVVDGRPPLHLAAKRQTRSASSPESTSRRSVSPEKSPLRLLGKSKAENNSPTTHPERAVSNSSTVTARRLSAESTAQASKITCLTGTGGKGRSASQKRADAQAVAAARAAAGGNQAQYRTPLSTAGNQVQQRRGKHDLAD